MSTTEYTPEQAADLLLQPEPSTEDATTEPPEATEDDVDLEAAPEAAEDDASEPADEEAEVDEDTEEPEVDEEPEKTRYTVKVDGVEQEVTLDQLKQAYSGQSYIQKGMQENAQARKTLEQNFVALQQAQNEFFNLYQRVQTEGFVPPPKEPDPELVDVDPIGYMQQQASYQQQMKRYQQQQQQIAQADQQRRMMQDRANQQILEQNAAKLMRDIPELADPATGKQLRERLFTLGMERYEFSAEEMNGLMDARYVNVLNDARKWNELQAGTAKAKKAPQPSKVVKPTARRPEPSQVAFKKKLDVAKKGGRPEDFASLLLQPRNG